MSDRTLLQYYPFSSMIDSSFWHELSRVKLEQLALNQTPLDVSVTYHLELNSTLPVLISLNYESFQSAKQIADSKRKLNSDYFGEHYAFGRLTVTNTLEEFTSSDKKLLISEAGKWIWDSVIDGSKQGEVDSNLEYYLSRFLMIVFADLKRYTYHYWCAFPALNYPSNCFQLTDSGNSGSKLGSHFTTEQLNSFLTEFAQLAPSDRLYFVIVIHANSETSKVQTFAQFWTKENVESLTGAKVYFVFSDPSPSSKYPGWPLRNYLAYLHVRFAQLVQKYPNEPSVQDFVTKTMFSPALNLLSFRGNLHPLRHRNEANLKMVADSLMQHSSVLRIVFGDSGNLDSLKLELSSPPPIVGWERNSERSNQLVPKFIDCSRQLDPKVLSNDAVHLNLKLMKWRLVPNIDLERVRNTRCLLLGAGTLGCNIARSLMAWGVDRITFVDSGHISYSNPVRQSLFTFEDCVSRDGKLKSKAQAAAESLRLINPGIEAEGLLLSVPMPGHSVPPPLEHQIEEDVKQLEKLISEHDVIFLLMDTRESRWLPSLIAASQHKTVINVALGFDTFLAQRHGIRFRIDDSHDQKNEDLLSKCQQILKETSEDSSSDLPNSSNNLLMGSDLGCYYCNDVFAPGDTTRDRTLDQQCTVSRPGLSMIASGYAVELLVSLLQHPAGPLAPAISNIPDDYSKEPESELLQPESILGLVPHQIRGFISRAEQITPCYRAFDHCTACSYTVIDKYRKEGFSFLLQVFNDSSILEEITGLKKFHQVDDELLVDDAFDFDDDEDISV